MSETMAPRALRQLAERIGDLYEIVPEPMEIDTHALLSAADDLSRAVIAILDEAERRCEPGIHPLDCIVEDCAAPRVAVLLIESETELAG